ncbi:UNVERIFIED_CONTAM: hypothetical protein FKN15_034820 [Acipenser sinensis]
MDRNALAELLQALESRRDAEERRREERYTALIERVGLAVAAATTPTTTPLMSPPKARAMKMSAHKQEPTKLHKKMGDWKDYIGTILKEKNVEDAAIVGYSDNKSVWASKPGGLLAAVNPQEVEVLVGKDRASFLKECLYLCIEKKVS